MKCLVTGGAGFIGSHIVDRLLAEGHRVVVYDNLSTGREMFIKDHFGDPHFKFIKADLADTKKLDRATVGADMVFHLAAHADVRSGFRDHAIDHEQNLEMTRNVLEAMSKHRVERIMFSSTSSVYGDATVHPTPEDYPFEPTSLYGATKAACESYIWTYASYYGMRAYVFRFVSFVGERYTHGIIFDILQKLKKNPYEIELFSDGTPRKSSVYVGDGVEAIMTVIKKSKERFNVFNIGHDEVVSVNDIVDWIIAESKSKGVHKKWLGKKSNWKGDNEFVYLANDKLKKIGWKPTLSIESAVKKATIYILENIAF